MEDIEDDGEGGGWFAGRTVGAVCRDRGGDEEDASLNWDPRDRLRASNSARRASNSALSSANSDTGTEAGGAGGATGGLWRGRGFSPRLGLLRPEMKQHVILINANEAREDPACFNIKGQGCQLGLEGMKDGNDPLDCPWTVLATRSGDRWYIERLAGVGASFGSP